MKMMVYALQEGEQEIFDAFAARYGIELTLTEQKPTLENAAWADGMDAVNVLSDTQFTPELWDRFYAGGVRMAVTRCVGMEHMNLPYAEKLGVPVYNVTYSPASVADYAIMMMLMVLRNIKPVLLRYAGQDYSQDGLRGRELPEMTVGVLGAGRIGQTLIRHLQGFGCRVVYWNRTPRPEMEGLAEYLPVEQVLAQSDIVSLHIASAPETFHFMDESRIAQMKPGAVLINTARGPLVDTTALIRALEEGRLSGAGLDVFDGDRTIYYRDHKNRMLCNHDMAILNAMPNVLMLPHLAYFTETATRDMVVNSLIAARQWADSQNKK